MKTYSEFRPTACDIAGLGLDDRQDWLVAPCSTNRDADLLIESNWHAQLACLDKVGNREDYEEHDFGHWACGWFRIVLVRPGSPAAAEAESIENALADYPILDESDLSEREYKVACDCIEYELQRLDVDADAGEVFSWLWDNDQGELENRDGNGASPSREAIELALEGLGFVFAEETENWSKVAVDV